MKATTYANWTPKIDLEETETQLILKAEIPGVRRKELRLQAGTDTVLISGEHQEKECLPGDLHCQELRHGRFQRLVQLPIPIQTDRVMAELIDGILTVTMTKA